MGKPTRPRFGSMGVWPRKRAKKTVARVRSAANSKDPKPLAFAGYKVGMTHLIMTGADKNKRSSGIQTAVPATILECPPMKIASARLYVKGSTGNIIVKQQLNFKTEKELLRKIPKIKEEKLAKPEDLEKINPDDYEDITIQMYTQPKQIKLKKTPELFEVKLGGNNKDKIEFIKKHITNPISITDVFKEGQFTDLHAITKGKGFQGPVKRFGIGLTASKSEKARRNPGSLGGWKGQAHVMYRVAHAGQTGYHQRVQYNNQIIKIGDKPTEINPKGGFINYGEVKSGYIIILGSVPGPKKRMITITEPVRPSKGKAEFTPESIKQISIESNQGR